MRVLLFAPFCRWSPHVETDLELAERHLAAGDEVVWMGCDGDLEACEPNPDHERAACLECIGKRLTGLGLLSQRVRFESYARYVTPSDRARAADLPSAFASHAELKALTLEGFDIGYAALSSLVWCARDADVDLGPENPRLGRFLRSAAEVYLSLRRYLAAERFDRIYLFNGRMSAMRAVLRAGRARDIDVYVHERGCDAGHYLLVHNALPHDIGAATERIQGAWGAPLPDTEQKTRIATEWFERRARGIVDCWASYTDQQAQGALPADWNPNLRNVVLYPSTEYEFASIGKEWWNPLFEVPTEGVVRIARALSAAGQVHLTIRMHPNPEGAGSTSAAQLRALELPGVTVVPPESPVSSYALLHASEKVVVTSSTMGVEATFWRKPSIQAGRSLYSDLGATHQPRTFAELIASIHDPDLAPMELDPALRYGYDQATYGVPFRHFRSEHLFAGTFKGKKVKPRGRYRMQLKLRRLGRKLSSVAPRVRSLLGSRS